MGQLKTNYIHKGVCLLFNEIYKRNYKIIYMTARAIGQYNQTRKFLVSEAVESNAQLMQMVLTFPLDHYS
jgi:phosphatidate phosphatase PAH1